MTLKLVRTVRTIKRKPLGADALHLEIKEGFLEEHLEPT